MLRQSGHRLPDGILRKLYFESRAADWDRCLMRRFCILLLLAPVLLKPALGAVRVWQGVMNLPTYQEGEPDRNPPFDLLQTLRFNYPYTIRDNLTDRRVDQRWRAIYLENEYLKCSVLPDLGGHLYTCVDKLSGQPMFYANPSIKKAEIGYRGAWAAFGIEFNFPVSHNWVSLSPVDFAYSAHADGSASVTVSNIDRVYGMQWTVELVLRPGSTILEERVTLSNRSDVRHRFYWWNNAGVKVWDDSRIEYPMRFVASHGFTEVQPWPVDSSGKDLSVIKNQTDGPVSYFAHGTREPYMAIWHPDSDTGVVHFADYAELPGKKIWSWGVDAEGLNWRKALSDDNSAYVEVQGGLFRNQETYAFLQPRQTIRFSEYWMPARGLGGVARANLAGVLNLARRNGNLVATFNANEEIRGARARVLDGEQILLDERVHLTPAETFSRKIAIANAGDHYTFELADASGHRLLRHTEGEYDWTPEKDIHPGRQSWYAIPPPERRTEGAWLELTKEQELNGEGLAPLLLYEQALRSYPQSFELRKAAGRLAASVGQYERAIDYLAPLAERETTEPEVAYYLAVAYDNTGDETNARAMYERAHRLPAFRAAASVRLAELEARAGRLSKAEEFLRMALDAEPDDLRAAEELIAVEGALGRKEEAKRILDEWLARAPFDNFLREQAGQPDLHHLGADPNRVLEVAAEYARLGLFEGAHRVLSREYPVSPPQESEPGSVLPQQHVMIAYFNAYCLEKVGKAAADAYRAASNLSTSFVFPSGEEAYAVLNAAIRNNEADATAHYLLGTLLLSQGDADRAIAEWQRAKGLAPDMRVLDADIGRARLHLKSDPQGALEAFRRGLSVDPENAELYSGVDEALSILNRPPSERTDALSMYPDLAHMPTRLLYELILSRAESGDFAGADDLFRNRFFPREEGGTNVQQVWVEVQLQHALADARSGQCTVASEISANAGRSAPGFTFTNDGLFSLLRGARAQYLLGLIDSRCGRTAEATRHFENARDDSSGGQMVWAYAAVRKLSAGQEAEWRGKLRSALDAANESTDAAWYSSPSMYNRGLLENVLGDRDKAKADFRRALLLPDQGMSHHLTRLARAEVIPECRASLWRILPRRSSPKRRGIFE